jgi:hypothetical protein
MELTRRSLLVGAAGIAAAQAAVRSETAPDWSRFGPPYGLVDLSAPGMPFITGTLTLDGVERQNQTSRFDDVAGWADIIRTGPSRTGKGFDYALRRHAVDSEGYIPPPPGTIELPCETGIRELIHDRHFGKVEAKFKHPMMELYFWQWKRGEYKYSSLGHSHP